MIDLHCHVLAGVDDGPATEADAIELARGAAQDGTRQIVATPHVNWAYPRVNAVMIQAAVDAFRRVLEGRGIPVALTAGAELAAARATELDDDELRALTLGDGPWLLLECPLAVSETPGFITIARSLAWRGHRLLLAHPERCPIFLRAPALLDDLVADGMLAQVTAGALTGEFGRPVRDVAQAMLERGVVHVIASDGHGAHRPARIATRLSQVGLPPALTAWLTSEVPAAVLAGRSLPPRPAGAEQRSRRRLLRLGSR